MPLLYRSMARADDGFPDTGERGLGVREDFDFADFDEEDGYVQPGMGGMSVNLDISAIPPYRLPPELGGTSKHPVWTIDSGDLGPRLEFVPDGHGSTHGVIGPITAMSLLSYRDALAETREAWTPVQS